MIGEEPPKTSDPEVAAKRAIDEAVATLRSLAETQSQSPARPHPERRPDRSFPGERQSTAEFFPSRPPLGSRLREGFHRLGVVLAVPCVIAAGVMFFVSSDLAKGQFDLRQAWPPLLAAAIVYVLCRSLAWVALGFIGEPANGHDMAVQTSQGIGWLWAPLLVAVLAPFAILENLYVLAANFREVMSRPLEVRAFLLYVAVIGLGLMMGWLYALVLMARRHRRFPLLYVVLSLLTLTMFTIGWLIATRSFGYVDTAEFFKTGAEALALAVWIPYMLLSQHVRSTFVN